MLATTRFSRQFVYLLSLAAGVAAAASAQGAVVAQYQFNGTDTSTAGLNFAESSGTTAATDTSIAPGSGLGAYFNTAGPTSGTDATDRSFGINLSKLATGVTGSKNSNDYLQFTVTPSSSNPGATQFQTLSVSVRVRSGSGGVARIGNVFLTTDADSYATTVAGKYYNQSVAAGGDTGYITTTFDLSGLAATTTARTFRINLYEDSSGSTLGDVALDNVTVNAAVPEPASLAAAGVGSLALLRRSRRV